MGGGADNRTVQMHLTSLKYTLEMIKVVGFSACVLPQLRTNMESLSKLENAVC